ncbi:MAG: hypothetical protein ACFBSC_16765 [Microcoleaceae cyanobacterium]
MSPRLIKQEFDRAAFKYWKHTGELPEQPRENPKPKPPIDPSTVTAIVKWKPQRVWHLDYAPGHLPEFTVWQEMGCPKVWFQGGDRLRLYAEAHQKGYPSVKDSSDAGQGKSHDSAEVSTSLLAIADTEARIFRLDPNHRNPSTASVENRYTSLVARHDGLDYAPSRTTPSGRPYLIKSKKPQPDLPPPCIRFAEFRMLADRDKLVFGGEGSPVCETCPVFGDCDFLKRRAKTLEKAYISADLNSISQPRSADVGVFEEAGTTIQNAKTTSISLIEIEQTIGKLIANRDIDPELYLTLAPVIDAVVELLKNLEPENKRHGASHREVIDSLPTASELEAELAQSIESKLLDPKVDIWTIPSLREVRDQCHRLLDANLEVILNNLVPEEERTAAISQNVLFNWLSPVLDALLGNKKINLRVCHGQLFITRRWQRHQSVIQKFGFRIFLDATLSVPDLAMRSGMAANTILEVSQIKPTYSNLTIHVVRGLGYCGKQRGDESQYGLKNRLRHAVLAIAEKHQDGNVSLIDHKSFGEEYQELLDADIIQRFGYWHRDTRGVNHFLSTQTLISVGKPLTNLGDLAARWQAQTGEIKDPTDLTGRYGAWVRRQSQAEMIQCVGRLRSHLRPGEKLNFYLVTSTSDQEIAALERAFPGAKVEVVEAYDLCPEAATKGEQTKRGMIAQLWSVIQAGEKATTTAISQAVGVSRGRISQISGALHPRGFEGFKGVLISLLDLLNRKTNTQPKFEDLPEGIRANIEFLERYLPAVMKDLLASNLTEVEAEAEIVNAAKVYGEKTFQAALAGLNHEVVMDLFTFFINKIPWDIQQRCLAEARL